MKKVAFLILTSGFLFFALSLVLTPEKATGMKNQPGFANGSVIPDSVFKVIQRACMDCHANDGSAMARGKLNFSKWAEYDAEKQVKKADAMCKELKKGSMPTKGWRKNNPDSVPTQAEVDMICNWAAGVGKP